MPAILFRQKVGQLLVVHEVAVVRKTDAVRRIDVKRLRLRSLCTAGGRVTDVPHASVAGQAQHVACTEYVTDQTVALPHVQAILAPGNDAGGILPAMLHDRQRIIERLGDR